MARTLSLRDGNVEGLATAPTTRTTTTTQRRTRPAPPSPRLKLHSVLAPHLGRPVMLCLLLSFLLPAAAASSPEQGNVTRQDGNNKWGYFVPRPNAHYFWTSYESPQRVSKPGMPWPTVLWLQGGPGGSGVGRGNFEEIGPLDVNLKPRKWTWLKIANLIFVDAPVGAGFSYVDDPSALVRSDQEAVADLFALLTCLHDKDIPDLRESPLYIVGESYGGKLGAILGLAVTEAIRAGKLNMTLGGVVLGDAWISPVDYALSYAQLLHSVSRLNDNAVLRVQRMAEMIEEQTVAGKFAEALQTFTDQLDLIDSESDSVNMDNFLLDTGMSPVLTQYMMRNSSLVHNTIEGDMNGPIREKYKIIPKNITWGEASLDTFYALNNSFMRPAIKEVGLLLSHGVKVSVYQGQYDVIASTIGAEAWVRKLKWSGLNKYLSLRRQPLHYCDTVEYCSEAILAYVRSYKNFAFYWVLGAGHMVPIDQPYVAFRIMANITQSPGATT